MACKVFDIYSSDEIYRTAYENGWKAFWNLVPKEENPCFPGEISWLMWFEGWENASIDCQRDCYCYDAVNQEL